MKKIGIIICGRYQNCCGCPSDNIEYVLEETIENGVEAIHLATGMVVGYPPCYRLLDFKLIIEEKYIIPVVLGTHPIAMKYLKTHENLPFWNRDKMKKLVPHLFEDREKIVVDIISIERLN